jgi:uncharacterized RDD family membrane protein YckC
VSKVHPLAARRGRGYLRDCVGYLGLAAATVPLGVLFHRRGWGVDRRLVLAVSALPPLAATLVAARQESGPRRATWGKRREGLVVVDASGGRLTFRRALVRNAVKVGVPWQLGHVVAIGSSFGGFQRRDPVTLAAAALTYPLLAAMVTAVTRGSGRGLHDRVARTEVRAEDQAQRMAPGW